MKHALRVHPLHNINHRRNAYPAIRRQVRTRITSHSAILRISCVIWNLELKTFSNSLKSELSCLRHKLNEEIEKVKSTVSDMETSLNAVWDTIKYLQGELKIQAELRKKHKESLEKHFEDNSISQNAKTKIALQESQINLSNTKLSEEQEEIIALENCSRRENPRFMNIPEQEHENSTDIVYDIVENGLKINTQYILSCCPQSR